MLHEDENLHDAKDFLEMSMHELIYQIIISARVYDMFVNFI